MNLTGSHTFKAQAQEIWDLLMDPDTLAKITPGISKLELTGDDSYKALAEVKIGPVKGTFKGQVDVKEKVEPQSFVLGVKQKSTIGNANADVLIKLDQQEDEVCVVSFEGKAKLSGLLARTGQRVIAGVANALSKQFFVALEKEIAAGRQA